MRFDNIRGDIYGGLTAAVVALPLALAFGVASGVGLMAGLYGAIFAGFFASLFGGTPSQISGPTGPMTVVMALVVTKYAGHPGVAFTVVMMGGLFQILFGALRLGQFISLVPFTVIYGFMSGIGVIIVILQLPLLMGHPAPSGGTIAASLLFVKRMSDLQLRNIRAADGTLGEVLMTAEEQAILDRHPSAILLYHFSGPISFGAAKGMTKQLVLGEHRKVVVLDLSDVTYIDTSGALAIEDTIIKGHGMGLEVFLVGMRAPTRKVLNRL